MSLQHDAKTTKSAEHKGRILLADDDDFRSALADVLTAEGYIVHQVVDGKTAQAAFEKESYDAVISDIRMPEATGVDLLMFVKRKASVPFVMMTGFANILETQKAHELGVNQFLTKPFAKKDLLSALELALRGPAEAPSANGEEANQDVDFCRLSIDEFFAGSKSKADIFVRLGPDKFLQIAKKGDGLSLARIESYKAKGLRFLYIKKHEWAKYVGFNLDLAKSSGRRLPLTKQQKLKFLKDTSDIILHDVFVLGLEREQLEEARSMVEATVSIIVEDRELFDLIDALRLHSDALYVQSLGTAFYATLLAREAGWTSGPIFFKVNAAGLLHDVGKTALAQQVIVRDPSTLTGADREAYEAHPAKSLELLALVRSLPDDVPTICYHHHENMTGKGFPQALSKLRIHPIAKLVSVADAFCKLALKSPYRKEGMDPEEAIKKVYAEKRQELDPVFLKSLMTLFKVAVPEELKRIAAAKSA